MSIKDLQKNSATDASLSGKQVGMWAFVDALMVKYGPLGAMLAFTCYYVLTKDKLIERKDEQISRQQEAMVVLTKASSEAIMKTGASSDNLARSVDDNTKTMARLVTIMERQAN